MVIEYFFHRESEKGEALRLLSEFYHLPTEDVVSKVKTLESRMENVCARAFPYVARMKEHFEDEGYIESLKVDFSKLFVGPFRMLAPPYGSVYMEGKGTVMGESTLDAIGRYKEEGLNISGEFHDAPDHIAAELEFLYFLIVKALDAARHADMDSSVRYLEKRRHFLIDHLSAWITEFQRNVEEKAETYFYKNLAKATMVLIQKDLEELSAYTMAHG